MTSFETAAFRPIASDEAPTLSGRLVRGPPPPRSTVFEAEQRYDVKNDFQGETSGWGRASPEYRDYTYMKVALAPSGTASFELEDGVYGSKCRATGYEFRGCVAYRVVEGSVCFYVDSIELAPAERWVIPRGPDGQRIGGPHASRVCFPGRVADERTPAELFEDVWNGNRGSHAVSSASDVKLLDHFWPAAALSHNCLLLRFWISLHVPVSTRRVH